MSREPQAWEQPFQEGRAHGAAGRYTEAVASFRQAILLDPREPYPHYELGYKSLMRRSPEEAQHCLERCIALGCKTQPW